MINCEICPIIATKNNNQDVILLETERWRVVLDPDQRFLGKSFITLLEHKESISDLSSDDWQELRVVMQRLEVAVSAVFRPSHFNWSCLMNNAAVADQSTHVHWHFHPRYKAPIEFVGDVFEDTELVPPKQRTVHLVDAEKLQTIASAIQAHL